MQSGSVSYTAAPVRHARRKVAQPAIDRRAPFSTKDMSMAMADLARETPPVPSEIPVKSSFFAEEDSFMTLPQPRSLPPVPVQSSKQTGDFKDIRGVGPVGGHSQLFQVSQLVTNEAEIPPTNVTAVTLPGATGTEFSTTIPRSVASKVPFDSFKGIEQTLAFPKSTAVLWDATPRGALTVLRPEVYCPVLSLTRGVLKAVATMWEEREYRSQAALICHEVGQLSEEMKSTPQRPILASDIVDGSMTMDISQGQFKATAVKAAKVDETDLAEAARASSALSDGSRPVFNAYHMRILINDVSSDEMEVNAFAVAPSTTFDISPINALRVIPCGVARALHTECQPGRYATGFLTMDQTRKLLLLAEDDPKAFDLPTVGIWISGASSFDDSFVWSAAVRYINHECLRSRVGGRNDSFLVVLYVTSGASVQPIFADCTPQECSVPVTVLTHSSRVHFDSNTSVTCKFGPVSSSEVQAMTRGVTSGRREPFQCTQSVEGSAPDKDSSASAEEMLRLSKDITSEEMRPQAGPSVASCGQAIAPASGIGDGVAPVEEFGAIDHRETSKAGLGSQSPAPEATEANTVLTSFLRETVNKQQAQIELLMGQIGQLQQLVTHAITSPRSVPLVSAATNTSFVVPSRLKGVSVGTSVGASVVAPANIQRESLKGSTSILRPQISASPERPLRGRMSMNQSPTPASTRYINDQSGVSTDAPPKLPFQSLRKAYQNPLLQSLPSPGSSVLDVFRASCELKPERALDESLDASMSRNKGLMNKSVDKNQLVKESVTLAKEEGASFVSENPLDEANNLNISNCSPSSLLNSNERSEQTKATISSEELLTQPALRSSCDTTKSLDKSLDKDFARSSRSAETATSSTSSEENDSNMMLMKASQLSFGGVGSVDTSIPRIAPISENLFLNSSDDDEFDAILEQKYVGEYHGDISSTNPEKSLLASQSEDEEPSFHREMSFASRKYLERHGLLSTEGMNSNALPLQTSTDASVLPGVRTKNMPPLE